MVDLHPPTTAGSRGRARRQSRTEKPDRRSDRAGLSQGPSRSRQRDRPLRGAGSCRGQTDEGHRAPDNAARHPREARTESRTPRARLSPSWRYGIMATMKTKELKNLLERAETWPEQAQDELVQVGREIEAEIGQGVYRLSEDERKGIERGLAA